MKKCFKCNKRKKLNLFYKHPDMADRHVNKCIECNKKDNRPANGKIKKRCLECDRGFRTNQTEINEGGGKVCSRTCYYKRFRKIVKKEDESPNWKGDKVGIEALHQWVIKHLGNPMVCTKCGTITHKRYEWANISRKYKRDLQDWIRLCKRCHVIYDGSPRGKQNKYPRLTIEQFNQLKI